MNGRSTSVTTGFGIPVVSGRSLVPSPPTRMTACTLLVPADALVDEAGGVDRRGIERVAPVDHDLARHRAGDGGPVEVAELLPLGHEDDGVGVLHGVHRGVAEAHALDQLGRLLLG